MHYTLNTIFSFPQSTVTDRMKPISVTSFRDHVQQMHAERDRGFEIEYQVQTCTANKIIYDLEILITVLLLFSPWDQFPKLLSMLQSCLSTEWRIGLLTYCPVSIVSILFSSTFLIPTELDQVWVTSSAIQCNVYVVCIVLLDVMKKLIKWPHFFLAQCTSCICQLL